MYETRWSRRRFIATGAIAAAAAGMPATLRAQTAKYTRYDVASTEGKNMLKGYSTAITQMLQLPPDHPHNWYRNTLVHTLDCPHGNWWFLPWHRGYIGYFEQVVRKYSGMPSFAFPYWDWTAQPEIPADFFGADNVLDPTSPLYIKSYEEFRAKFEQPIAALYASFSAAQNTQLQARGLATPAELWQGIAPPGGYFAPGDTARCLKAGQPSFANPPVNCEGNCASTPAAVSASTIKSALAPTTFVPFGSGIVDQHSQSTTQGVLESQPHNLVHNCVGGFMGDFMSPVDPIFMMHHSNIERLWLVWTAKQEQAGNPTLPEGAERAKWDAQPFLFYIDEQGQTLSKKAGDFATVGSFDYTYTRGTGSAMFAAAKPGRAQYFAAASAVPDELVKRAGASEEGPELFAEVPIDPEGRQKGKVFHILVNPPAGLDPTDVSSPHHAATVAFFGSGHGHAHGKSNFIVQLSPALRKLTKAGLFKPGDKIKVVVATEDAQRKAAPKSRLATKAVEVPIHVF